MLNLVTSLASLLLCKEHTGRFWGLEHGHLWGPFFIAGEPIKSCHLIYPNPHLGHCYFRGLYT